MKSNTITITLDTDNALDLLVSLWYSLQRLEDIDTSFQHKWDDLFWMTGDEALDWADSIYNKGLVLSWMIDKNGITQPCLRS